MDSTRVALSVGLIAAVAGAAWLYRDNARLRGELAARPASEPAAQRPVAPVAAADEPAGPGRGDGEAQPAPDGFVAPREPPTLPEPQRPVETRGERRARVQGEIAAMLGRLDGESAEDYRARMVPLVEAALSGPRRRAQEQRREIEEAAGVSEEQRAELDALFADVHAEVLELTNRAIATGELTPYERNWAGALNFAGGVGAILGGAESRVGQILSPEQTARIYDMGFEWGEYLGVTAPWETLNAPPPPES